MTRISQAFGKMTILACAVVIMLGALGSAQPAAAAPAQPYRVESCYQHSEGPDEYELCLTSHGVVQVTESASGVTTSTFTGRTSSIATENGEVVYSGESADHVTVVAKNGVDQVFHQRGSGSSVTGEGLTCAVRYNTIYASGDVRHEVLVFECN